MVMMKSKHQEGYTLVELMVVVAIMAVLIAMTGSFSSKAVYRRSVDSVTSRVANTLQLTKLQAARNGVEYRTRFVQNDKELQLITERGNSNVDSTVWKSDQNSVVSINLDSSVIISNMPTLFEFSPNGTAGPNNNFTALADSGTGVDRCGRVVVSELGRIKTIQGHWDGTNCIQVQDK